MSTENGIKPFEISVWEDIKTVESQKSNEIKTNRYYFSDTNLNNTELFEGHDNKRAYLKDTITTLSYDTGSTRLVDYPYTKYNTEKVWFNVWYSSEYADTTSNAVILIHPSTDVTYKKLNSIYDAYIFQYDSINKVYTYERAQNQTSGTTLTLKYSGVNTEAAFVVTGTTTYINNIRRALFGTTNINEIKNNTPNLQIETNTTNYTFSVISYGNGANWNSYGPFEITNKVTVTNEDGTTSEAYQIPENIHFYNVNSLQYEFGFYTKDSNGNYIKISNSDNHSFIPDYAKGWKEQSGDEGIYHVRPAIRYPVYGTAYEDTIQTQEYAYNYNELVFIYSEAALSWLYNKTATLYSAEEVTKEVTDTISEPIYLIVNIATSSNKTVDNVYVDIKGNQVSSRQYYQDRKIATICSDEMIDSPLSAVEPKFTTKISGEHELSFKMYRKYFDYDANELVTNPLIKYIYNEAKIKLKYDDEWYDFIIKSTEENSEDYSTTFTCQDLFETELGKNGYNVELNTELENNIGTIQELATSVLENSGWELDTDNSDILRQRISEGLYKAQVKIAFTYYRIEQTDYTKEGPYTIAAGKTIYIPYSVYHNTNTYFQFFYEQELTDDSDSFILDEDCYITNAYDLVVEDFDWSNLEDEITYDPSMVCKRLNRAAEVKYDAKLDKYVNVYHSDSVLNDNDYIELNNDSFSLGVTNIFSAYKISSNTTIYNNKDGLYYCPTSSNSNLKITAAAGCVLVKIDKNDNGYYTMRTYSGSNSYYRYITSNEILSDHTCDYIVAAGTILNGNKYRLLHILKSSVATEEESKKKRIINLSQSSTTNYYSVTFGLLDDSYQIFQRKTRSSEFEIFRTVANIDNLSNVGGFNSKKNYIIKSPSTNTRHISAFLGVNHYWMLINTSGCIVDTYDGVYTNTVTLWPGEQVIMLSKSASSDIVYNQLRDDGTISSSITYKQYQIWKKGSLCSILQNSTTGNYYLEISQQPTETKISERRTFFLKKCVNSNTSFKSLNVSDSLPYYVAKGVTVTNLSNCYIIQCKAVATKYGYDNIVISSKAKWKASGSGTGPLLFFKPGTFAKNVWKYFSVGDLISYAFNTKARTKNNNNQLNTLTRYHQITVGDNYNLVSEQTLGSTLVSNGWCIQQTDDETNGQQIDLSLVTRLKIQVATYKILKNGGIVTDFIPCQFYYDDNWIENGKLIKINYLLTQMTLISQEGLKAVLGESSSEYTTYISTYTSYEIQDSIDDNTAIYYEYKQEEFTEDQQLIIETNGYLYDNNDDTDTDSASTGMTLDDLLCNDDSFHFDDTETSAELYGYSSTTYVTPTLVQSYLTNGTNITDDTGWSLKDENTLIDFTAGLYPDERSSTFSSSSFDPDTSSCLRVKFNSWGAKLKNEGLTSNASTIQSIAANELYVLRLKYRSQILPNESSGNYDTIKSASTHIPDASKLKRSKLYYYDNDANVYYSTWVANPTADSNHNTGLSGRLYYEDNDGTSKYIAAFHNSLADSTSANNYSNGITSNGFENIGYNKRLWNFEMDSNEQNWTTDNTKYQFIIAPLWQAINLKQLSGDTGEVKFYLETYNGTKNNRTYYIESIELFPYKTVEVDNPYYDSTSSDTFKSDKKITVMVRPGDIIVGDDNSSLILTTNYIYDPNQSYTSADDINYEYKGDDDPADHGYEKQYDETFQKKLTVTADNSNYFNIIQDLCEKFECWAQFDIGHNDDGSIKFSDQGLPIKKIRFKEYIDHMNYSGFHYGVNVKSIKRQIDSKDFATKLIVLTNTNEYADNGFCTIQRAADNPAKSTFIFNFSYYINQGLLDREKVLTDINELNNSYAVYSNLISDYDTKLSSLKNSQDKLKANYTVYSLAADSASENLIEVNEELQSNYRIANGSSVSSTGVTFSLLQSAQAIALFVKLGTTWERLPQTSHPKYYTGAVAPKSPKSNITYGEGWSENTYYTVDSYGNDELVSGKPSDWTTCYTTKYYKKSENVYPIETWSKLKTEIYDDDNGSEIVNLYNQCVIYKNQQTTYRQLYKVEKAKYDSVTAEIEALESKMAYIKEQAAALLEEFQHKYRRFIQEGTWQDDDYTDDNKYYIDAVQTLATSAMPQITYTIDVLELSQLDGYELFDFAVGDRTYIEDPEFFGYEADGVTPYREEVILSESSVSLLNPSANSLKIQNYKTRFDDLFQRITATTQQLSYKAGGYNRAAAVVKSDGTIDTDLLQTTLSSSNLSLTSSNNVKIDGNSIKLYSATGNGIELTGTGISILKNGTKQKVLNSTDGINSSLLRVGHLDTSKITIGDFSGDNDGTTETAFLWNKDGIYAFGHPIEISYDNDTTVTQNDKNKFVRFFSNGLSVMANSSDNDGPLVERLKIGYINKNDYVINKNLNSNFRLDKNSLAIGTDEYGELTEEPSDWADNYTSYYYYDSGSYTYELIPSQEETPTFEANKYYTKNSFLTDDSIMEVSEDESLTYKHLDEEFYGIAMWNNNGEPTFWTDSDTGDAYFGGEVNIDDAIYVGRYGGSSGVPAIWSALYENSSGASGFYIDNDVAIFQNAQVRGKIQTATFEYEKVSAIGGIFTLNPGTTIEKITNEYTIKYEPADGFTVNQNDYLIINAPYTDKTENYGTQIVQVQNVDTNTHLIKVYEQIENADQLNGSSLINLYHYDETETDQTTNIVFNATIADTYGKKRGISMWEWAHDDDLDEDYKNYKLHLGVLADNDLLWNGDALDLTNGDYGLWADTVFLSDAHITEAEIIEADIRYTDIDCGEWS